MDPLPATIALLTLALAAANGANDNAKGVATLAGAGVTRYRTALLWGTAATLAGSLLSFPFAERMTALFTHGIVTAAPTPAFALAVLAGASAWVALTTATRLPVSTTHAIVGALIGVGIQIAPGSVNWDGIPTAVVAPLLLSVAVSYVLSTVLAAAPLRLPECVCVGATTPAGVVVGPTVAAAQPSNALPLLGVRTGTVAECRAHGRSAARLRLTVTGLHWLTSGATSFARGLNDTPKIVAIGAFGLVPAGVDLRYLVAGVAAAMAAAGLLAGTRIARTLGERVVRMDHVEGFRANVVAALLVGVGASQGLPMSTTHVTTGAIAGTAGRDPARLNRRTLRDLALAWTATPLTSALVAALAFRIAS